ncbi:MAG: TrkH family potassium uptake protein, partial [Victivallales bacterium]|nr:TrkH family potassium uptake protein [Victivallales bacterium]
YNNLPTLQWIVIFYMFVSACNFSLMVKLFTTRKFPFFQDEEFRVFFGIFVVATLFTATMLYVKCPDGLNQLGSSTLIPRGLETYLRTAAFQVITVLSTTGFCTSDYQTWKIPSVLLLFCFLMWPCGCGGSTAGGIKMSRLIVLFKHLLYEIRHCLSPRMVPDVRLNGERISQALVGKTVAFVALYVSCFCVVAFLLAIVDGSPFDTACGAALTCLSNVGPGFGAVGPAGSFAGFSPFAKFLLTLTMIAGRLELYTILVLFNPAFWRWK